LPVFRGPAGFVTFEHEIQSVISAWPRLTEAVKRKGMELIGGTE
jgi:hypothetical protein